VAQIGKRVALIVVVLVESGVFYIYNEEDDEWKLTKRIYIYI